MATITDMGTAMTTDPVPQAALYRLLAFLSPAFPVGAFTYSHGLEQVIEDGDVRDAASLQAWLVDILRYGAGRSDAILLKETMFAAERGDETSLRELIDLGLALQPSKERHLETSAQGTAFVKAVREAWMPSNNDPATVVFSSLANSEDAPETWPYPVAVGLTAAAWKLPVEATVMSFLHAFSANIISAAVRAVPLGQSDGQRVLAALEPVISQVTSEALDASCDDLGTSTFLADIASMAHETQYTRLFRS